MATSIPKTQANNMYLLQAISSINNNLDIQLNYSGKQTEDVILKQQSADARVIWSRSQKISQPNRLYF